MYSAIIFSVESERFKLIRSDNRDMMIYARREIYESLSLSLLLADADAELLNDQYAVL